MSLRYSDPLTSQDEFSSLTIRKVHVRRALWKCSLGNMQILPYVQYLFPLVCRILQLSYAGEYYHPWIGRLDEVHHEQDGHDLEEFRFNTTRTSIDNMKHSFTISHDTSPDTYFSISLMDIMENIIGCMHSSHKMVFRITVKGETEFVREHYSWLLLMIPTNILFTPT